MTSRVEGLEGPYSAGISQGVLAWGRVVSRVLSDRRRFFSRGRALNEARLNDTSEMTPERLPRGHGDLFLALPKSIPHFIGRT